MTTFLLKNLTVATMTDGQPYGLIENAAILIKDQTITWVGPAEKAPNAETVDLGGRLVTPGLIDCHTHLVFGGNRAKEFEMRLNGASYEELARAGGGIVSTVTATRDATLDDLVAGALPRLDAMIAEGVTTVEIKSGYGLDLETEMRMLQAAKRLSTHRAIRVKTSFLGAHAVPAEYKDRPDAYIDDICIPALKEVAAAGLADAVDGFCENIAFTPAQIARVFDAAQALGIPIKLHAEQLSHLGGTLLAASYNALSADHVEYATDEDAAALAKSGSVAVILPGAFYTVKETQLPPIQSFRDHRVPMAVATDCNPGSSPMTSPLLAMNMASTLFSLTPEEGLRGVTHHAARALGLTKIGQIAPGYTADLAVWDIKNPSELAYRIGFNPLYKRIFGGQL